MGSRELSAKRIGMFTPDEQTILASMDGGYMWIARDEDGGLFVFSDRPHISNLDGHGNRFFDCDEANDDCMEIPFNDIFKSVTFENSPVCFRDPLLSDREKRYLEAVLKPLCKDGSARLCFIKLASVSDKDYSDKVHLRVVFENETLAFPPFKKREMYAGLDVDENYVPDELGLNL